MEKEKFSVNNEELIVKEVRAKVLSLYNLDMDQAGQLIEKQRDYYEGKYQNYNNFILYHAMLLSNQPADMQDKIFDFPGEDSVLIFLEKTANELEKNKTPDGTD